jgi:hypothetical protein
VVAHHDASSRCCSPARSKAAAVRTTFTIDQPARANAPARGVADVPPPHAAPDN